MEGEIQGRPVEMDGQKFTMFDNPSHEANINIKNSGSLYPARNPPKVCSPKAACSSPKGSDRLSRSNSFTSAAVLQKLAKVLGALSSEKPVPEYRQDKEVPLRIEDDTHPWGVFRQER